MISSKRKVSSGRGESKGDPGKTESERKRRAAKCPTKQVKKGDI